VSEIDVQPEHGVSVEYFGAGSALDIFWDRENNGFELFCPRADTNKGPRKAGYWGALLSQDLEIYQQFCPRLTAALYRKTLHDPV
jgi:hypothetical protein